MRITFRVVAGPNKEQTFHFDCHDTFIVGRGSTAHLKLPPKDRYFSRHHFLVEVNPPLCRLTNLSTTNGTFVNGRRVSTIELQHGDVIVGGDTALKVEFADAASSDQAQVAVNRSEATASAVFDARGNRGTMVGAAVRHLDVSRQRSSASRGQIGDYQILRELGRGGMGVVYLAKQNATNRLCALKAIPASGATKENDIKRFLREAAVLHALQHENIVSYQDCGHDQEHVFFAMEYVDGSDARTILKQQGPIAVDRAVAWLCQLLDALEYAHNLGFVHRDIKPANLLVTEVGGVELVKLADFGLARVYQASTLSGLTLDGDVGGSLPFMPPEQITNYRDVDPRCDIYSAGATLYTLLSGHYIYELPKRTADAVVMILQEEPMELGVRCPLVPSDLRAIIHRSVARRPEHRFSCAAELRAALLSYADRL